MNKTSFIGKVAFLYNFNLMEERHTKSFMCRKTARAEKKENQMAFKKTERGLIFYEESQNCASPEKGRV